MQENKPKKKKQKNINAEFRFLLFRVISVIIVVLTLTAFKYALPKVFGEIKEFYNTVFSVDINADNILKEGEKM